MNSFLASLAPLAQPVGRALMALIFIMAGFSKIGGYAGTAQFMDAMGVPGMLLPLVILLELGGGIMLLIGWQARLAAFLLGGFSVIAGVIFHLVPSFGLEGMAAQTEMIMFMKNLAIAGGLGFVVAHGAGALSVDGRGAAAQTA